MLRTLLAASLPGATLAALVLCFTGCQPRSALNGDEENAGENETENSSESSDDNDQRAAASRRQPAGATCAGRADCLSDQVCVEHRCRYRSTSVAGEVLAAGANAQAEAGDDEGAIDSFEAAFTAFAQGGAPIPPEVSCAAATVMLRTASDNDSRDRAGRRADLCFRSTLPGDPRRSGVRDALARLRFEGLDLSQFDAESPAERFFTQEPGRPTLDAVQIQIHMPDLEPTEPRTHSAVRELFSSEAGIQAIAECFLQDWDARHARTAEANLELHYATQMQDMGDYDRYTPSLELRTSTTSQDGFEPCLSRALGELFAPENRSGRGQWVQPVRITARVQ